MLIWHFKRNATVKDGQFPTIEDEIVKGLVKLNAIPENHANEMFKVSTSNISFDFNCFDKEALKKNFSETMLGKKMSFQRAARTDKGVSAARNLLSLMMELAEDTVEKLNVILPKQIRVFGKNA